MRLSQKKPQSTQTGVEATCAKKIKGGLVVDSRAGVRKGDDTGTIITPEDPDASMLIQAIRHLDEDTAMPPKEKLSPAIIADLEQWVRMGAPDPRSDDTVAAVQKKSSIDWTTAREWWSFKPLAAPTAPAVKDVAWAVSDIDRFVLAKVEAAGLTPAADAEKAALIRRATYDLTGLPPTPAEVEAFLADARPNAFAAVIDRLLASPRYGELWGRHWLDVVRYADSAGDNSDFPIPQMRRYRDWVIEAFNRDMPYDRFVREQLAGDLLGGEGDERLARITATGYLANARRFGSRVDDYPWHLTIEDSIDNVGRAFLGSSLSCSRCHDHKFDPITQNGWAVDGFTPPELFCKPGTTAVLDYPWRIHPDASVGLGPGAGKTRLKPQTTTHPAGIRRGASMIISKRERLLDIRCQVRRDVRQRLMVKAHHFRAEHQRAAELLDPLDLALGDGLHDAAHRLDDHRVGARQHDAVDVAGFGDHRRRIVTMRDVLRRIDDRIDHHVLGLGLAEHRQVWAEVGAGLADDVAGITDCDTCLTGSGIAGELERLGGHELTRLGRSGRCRHRLDHHFVRIVNAAGLERLTHAEVLPLVVHAVEQPPSRHRLVRETLRSGDVDHRVGR